MEFRLGWAFPRGYGWCHGMDSSGGSWVEVFLWVIRCVQG